MLSNQTNRNQFNLIHEIGKEGTYHLLFPPQQAGLAILNLYQKVRTGAFPNKRFKETDIYAALEGSKLLMREEEYDRLPQQRFNTIISDLQVYFLRYDTDEQLYSLKDYAETFCRHAEDTLLANFNPTQIEAICNDLRAKLEACRDERQVMDWISTFFSPFKPVMKSQVDRLERHIDQSVQDIRATTQISDLSIIEVLKAIDEKLDRLRTQNEELRSAFREMKTINLVLEELLHIVTDNDINDSISEVRGFFPEVKYTLNLIDKRLDRIQPKLRQFFAMLNKPSFNIRIEKFLKFLLSSSSLNVQKQVTLPEGIPIFAFHQPRSNFTIFERRDDLFPTKPKPRLRVEEDLEEKQKGLAVARNQLSMYNQIDKWIALILAEASMGERVFSKYFFSIIDEQSGAIELALNVAYALIRRADNDEKLHIEISTQKIKHPSQNISLWEMTINYQK